MRASILEMMEEDVIISGDGQSDSPGHSAKYLTYVVMLCNNLKDYIIHIECLDKREVGGKSPNMEVEALKRSVRKLREVITIAEVVTDASTSAIKMMGK